MSFDRSTGRYDFGDQTVVDAPPDYQAPSSPAYDTPSLPAAVASVVNAFVPSSPANPPAPVNAPASGPSWLTLDNTTRALANDTATRSGLATMLDNNGDRRSPEQWLLDDLKEGDSNSYFRDIVQKASYPAVANPAVANQAVADFNRNETPVNFFVPKGPPPVPASIQGVIDAFIGGSNPGGARTNLPTPNGVGNSGGDIVIAPVSTTNNTLDLITNYISNFFGGSQVVVNGGSPVVVNGNSPLVLAPSTSISAGNSSPSPSPLSSLFGGISSPAPTPSPVGPVAPVFPDSPAASPSPMVALSTLFNQLFAPAESTMFAARPPSNGAPLYNSAAFGRVASPTAVTQGQIQDQGQSKPGGIPTQIAGVIRGLDIPGISGIKNDKSLILATLAAPLLALLVLWLVKRTFFHANR